MSARTIFRQFIVFSAIVVVMGGKPVLASTKNKTLTTDFPNEEPRRRLDIMWQYHTKHKRRAVPRYKEKSVRPEINDWHRNFYFNTPGSRHRRRRSAAYVALTAKEYDPVVKALARYASETRMEMATALQLRAGDQREHSKQAPFHAALLVGHHVSGDASCIAGAPRIRCNPDDVAYFTVLRDPLRFAQDYFYRMTRRFGAELGSTDFKDEQPGEFTPQHILAIEAFATQQPRRLLQFGNNKLRMRPMFAHFAPFEALHKTPAATLFKEAADSSREEELSSGVRAAVHVLRLYRFVVGFEDELDEFLVLLRARLGWGFRSLLSLRESSVAVEDRRIFKPGLRGWPLQYVSAMNRTSAVQEDWAFLGEMRRQLDDQQTAFGEVRLDDETAQLRGICSALQRLCDPSSSSSRGSSFRLSGSHLVSAVEETIDMVHAGVRPCEVTDSASAAAVSSREAWRRGGDAAHLITDAMTTTATTATTTSGPMMTTRTTRIIANPKSTTSLSSKMRRLHRLRHRRRRRLLLLQGESKEFAGPSDDDDDDDTRRRRTTGEKRPGPRSPVFASHAKGDSGIRDEHERRGVRTATSAPPPSSSSFPPSAFAPLSPVANRCSREPEVVFRCMLERYDNCKAGIGPHALCDYYDESS